MINDDRCVSKFRTGFSKLYSSDRQDLIARRLKFAWLFDKNELQISLNARRRCGQIECLIVSQKTIFLLCQLKSTVCCLKLFQ